MSCQETKGLRAQVVFRVNVVGVLGLGLGYPSPAEEGSEGINKAFDCQRS